MSVFTVVEADALASWLDACGAGPLESHSGVAGGVENTNYRITTTQGEFVLTLFEWMPRADAERTLALTDHLARLGLPVAAPWRFDGGWTAMLAGKPAALCRWLPGAHPAAPTAAQCAAIGTFLARLHGASSARIADTRGDDWMRRTAEALGIADRWSAPTTGTTALPTGLIHADLFRDNALFEDDALTGVIDFHYACTGPLLYDVAVAALDWCFNGCSMDPERLESLCRGYEAVRPPVAEERRAFPAFLERAALRFWLSRAHDLAFPRAGGQVLVKDPKEMSDRRAWLRAHTVDWPA